MVQVSNPSISKNIKFLLTIKNLSGDIKEIHHSFWSVFNREVVDYAFAFIAVHVKLYNVWTVFIL